MRRARIIAAVVACLAAASGSASAAVHYTAVSAVIDPASGHGDHFGQSIAVSGATMAVGSPTELASSGAVTVFTRSGAGWTRVQSLRAPTPTSNSYFGYAVALDAAGSELVVGQPATGALAGTVFVYDRSGTGSSPWQLAWTVRSPHPAANDSFGQSVSVDASGSYVVVGAPAASGTRGAAFVYHASGSSFALTAQLEPAGLAAYVAFGYSVAMSATAGTIVVGGPWWYYAQGAAFVFTRSGATWQQVARLTDTSGQANDSFGASVAVGPAGEPVAVGALGYTGTVELFAGHGTSWARLARLSAPGLTLYHDDAGSSLALSSAGTGIIVGDPLHSTGEGQAVVYASLSPTSTVWVAQATLSEAHPARGDAFGAAVAWAGTDPVVSADSTFNQMGTVFTFAP